MHAVEEDGALKRKAILPQAATWRDREDVTLSEISQPQKDKSVGLHSQEVPRVVGVIGTERRSAGARA